MRDMAPTLRKQLLESLPLAEICFLQANRQKTEHERPYSFGGKIEGHEDDQEWEKVIRIQERFATVRQMQDEFESYEAGHQRANVSNVDRSDEIRGGRYKKDRNQHDRSDSCQHMPIVVADVVILDKTRPYLLSGEGALDGRRQRQYEAGINEIKRPVRQA